MPLTGFQAKIAKLLAVNRSPDSHLAGGGALHFAPESIRYSNDLDYFQDSEQRVATAFTSDRTLLEENGYAVDVKMQLSGFIRAIVEHSGESTKIEWAYDSSWRFMPAVKNEDCGYQLHSVDLSVNKILALAGRDEPRDFLDVMYIHQHILPVPALCWAAVGKDPGFTPLSLLELLRRRGKYQSEDFSRLMLAKDVNLQELKSAWLEILEQTEEFVKLRPPSEAGCLYFSPETDSFILPINSTGEYSPHFGRPGGVIPVFS